MLFILTPDENFNRSDESNDQAIKKFCDKNVLTDLDLLQKEIFMVLSV